MVKGYTAGKCVGVVCITGRTVNTFGAPGTNVIGNKRAGDIVDVMTNGEIVELTGLVAGTKYFGALDGNSLTAVAATNLVMIGWTVEAGRLIVRVQTAPNVLP